MTCALIVSAACQRGEDTAQPRTTRPTIREDTAVCDPAKPLAPGVSASTMKSDDFERAYRLYTPVSYTGSARVPVVLEFHGFGSGAERQMSYGSFTALADRDGFLVVAPEGQGEPRHFTLQGGGAGVQDDVAFVVDLIDHLARRLCVDRRRIYATGMSNGGGLTSMLACRESDRIAAFATVALVLWAPFCDAARTVPVIAFHGTEDPIVPFQGGEMRCCGNPSVSPAAETMASWAKHNGCQGPPEEDKVRGAVTVIQYTSCEPNGVVKLYVIRGGGHTWPGTDLTQGTAFLGTTTEDIDASEVIWTFFKEHHI